MPATSDDPLDALQARLGFTFHDRSLLEQALTHRSATDEEHDQPRRSNERLEFLGDAALEASFAFHLFESHPEWSRGELSAARAAALSRATLAGVGRALGLEEALRVGPGEEYNNVRRSASVLAGAVEAIAGAVCLETVAANTESYAAHPVLSAIAGPLVVSIVRQRPDVQFGAFLQDLTANLATAPPSFPSSDSSDRQEDDLSALEQRLKYRFREHSLLRQALTHASYRAVGGAHPTPSNGRLAFIGAAFVKVSLATVLYLMCPHLSEGGLTRLRAIGASNAALGRLGRFLGLGKFLLLGPEGEGRGWRRNAFILGDAAEALLGAICQDAVEADPERLKFRMFMFRLLGTHATGG